jgi:hypothetical protein
VFSGGKTSERSQLGKETTFTITLSIHADESPEAAEEIWIVNGSSVLPTIKTKNRVRNS